MNPALERLASTGEQLAGDPVEDLSSPESKDKDSAGLAAEKDECLANLMQLDESWQEYMRAGSY